MERPSGVNMIYSCGGDPLCTSYRGKGLYGKVRYWGYMKVSRLKSKSGSSSHTGGSVQGRAALLYSMVVTYDESLIKNVKKSKIEYFILYVLYVLQSLAGIKLAL